jgi:sensor histidine kinase YesM
MFRVYLTNVKFREHYSLGQMISYPKWKLRFSSMERDVIDATTFISLWASYYVLVNLRSISFLMTLSFRKSLSVTCRVPALKGMM